MTAQLPARLVLPPITIGLMLLAVGAGAAWYTNRLQRQASDILVLNVGSMRASEELELGLREIRTLLIEFQFTGDWSRLEAVRPLRVQTDRWIDEAERLATTPQEQTWMMQARTGYAQVFSEL